MGMRWAFPTLPALKSASTLLRAFTSRWSCGMGSWVSTLRHSDRQRIGWVYLRVGLLQASSSLAFTAAEELSEQPCQLTAAELSLCACRSKAHAHTRLLRKDMHCRCLELKAATAAMCWPSALCVAYCVRTQSPHACPHPCLLCGQ
jgi:hypothetical protein